MGGIVFFRTGDRDAVVEFYTERVGASVWLEQPDCTVLSFDGFRFGFPERGTPETAGTLTFVVPHRTGVDRLHDELEAVATAEPVTNRTDAIYQFSARDPEGRTVEIQTYL